MVVPWAYTLVKLLGAGYLIYVAVGMWRGARSPVAADPKPARHAFRQGLAVNLLNPKSVLFAAAVLVVIFPPDLSLGQSLIIVANHLAVELLFYTALACAMSSAAVSRRYMAAKLWFDRCAALVLGGLGLRLLLSR